MESGLLNKAEYIVSNILEIELSESDAVLETGFKPYEELGGIVPGAWVVELQPTQDGFGQWNERSARFQFWRGFRRGN